MSSAFVFLTCFFSICQFAYSGQTDEQDFKPAAFIGTQTVWDAGSVNVEMANREGSIIEMTLRGKSSSECPEQFLVFLGDKPLKYKSKEHVVVQNGLREILDNTDSANWKCEKIKMLLGFLDRDKKYDGVDARKLLQNQPFGEVFEELRKVKEAASARQATSSK